MANGRCWFPILLGMALLLPLSIPVPVPGAEPDVVAAELPRLPPVPPARVLETFQVKEGFRLELVAAEPLVADPIALAFDEDQRLYVVEMRGYSERRTERLSRIRLLEDTDSDGRFDQSHIFASGLEWPTAITCWDGGVFVGDVTDIWYFKDQDGDGQADQKEKVFTGFSQGVQRVNVQALLNSLTWGLDHRLHGATSFSGGAVVRAGQKGASPTLLRGRDFSFDPRVLDFRAESGGGQHGLTFDDVGRKYVCSNSRHIQQVMYEDRYTSGPSSAALPSPLLDIAEDGAAAEVFRLSPDEPWRIVRTRWRIAGLVPGPVEGGGRVSGYFTAATGITIYRGNAWPDSYRGDALVGDAGSNLIHHKALQPDGVKMKAGRSADELNREFIASTDNWFRPVSFVNGPDGCLYIADMYREVIEHPWSLPEPIKSRLDLNSGLDRGRIYRVVPDGFKQPKPTRLSQATTLYLVQALEHPNGWHRDTAARLLHQRQDAVSAKPLRQLLLNSKVPLARLHALYALDGLGGLMLPAVSRALKDADPAVRKHGVRLMEKAMSQQSSFTGKAWNQLAGLARDPDPEVRFQLALTLGHFKHANRLEAFTDLARHEGGVSDPWLRAALLHALAQSDPALSAPGVMASLLIQLLKDSRFIEESSGQEFLRQLARLIGVRGQEEDLKWVLMRLNQAHPSSSHLSFARRAGLLMELDRGWTVSKKSSTVLRTDPVWMSTTAQAVTHLKDQAGPESDRQLAIALLGNQLQDHKDVQAQLISLLHAAEPVPSVGIRQAALKALVGTDAQPVFQELLSHWKSFSMTEQKMVLPYFLRRPERALLLLEGIESSLVSRDVLDATQKNQLRSHGDSKVRTKALSLLGIPAKPADLMSQYEPALKLAGRPDQGLLSYQQRCASCHRAGQQGHAVGPDFEALKSGGPDKLLVGILDPSREVAPKYVHYEIQTRDGETWDGIIDRETTTGLTLKQANGVEIPLNRTNVVSMRSQGKSMMPEGLLQDMTTQDLADLIAFILQ